MRLICVSRGSYSKGKELAESLANKLGYYCLSREELLERATERGIPVGKMEMAMIKPHTFLERFALEKEHYKALAAAIICEHSFKQNLIYHGRAGHLLLPGVRNIMRVRVVADMDSRIDYVEQKLGLDRTKAKKYIEQVEEDRERWVRVFYNVDWDEYSQYDIIVNTDHLTVENAAIALCNMVELPEFQFTPASKKAMEDLYLSARCRLAVFDNPITYAVQVNVRADGGKVMVTYPPQQAQYVEAITEAVSTVDGVKEILCTMAQTNILWVQERFDPQSETLNDIIKIADKWGAAVELTKLVPGQETTEVLSTFANGIKTPDESGQYNGGIEDEPETPTPAPEDKQLVETYNKLISAGHAGITRIVKGSPRGLLQSMQEGIKYSLVVVGDVFLSKGHASRTRLTNELVFFLMEQLKVPVVQANELKQQFLFGKKQLIILISQLVAVAVIYYLVFSNQIPVLKLTRLEGGMRVLSVLFILGFVPFISYLWGKTASLFLKLIKIE